MRDGAIGLTTPPKPIRNFYGRRYGKRLRQAQRQLLDQALKPISVPLESHSCSPAGQSPLDLQKLFGGKKPVWLEVGFGSGEHMVHQAQLHSDIGIIGCEPFVNGVASLLSKLRDSPCSNIRIHAGDVRDVMDCLPRHALSRVFLIYPDPWPKKRHHRRRFMTPEYLQPLADVMKPGACLRLATDIADYARQAVEEISLSTEFEWEPSRQEDWQVPWNDWLPTRYEHKALRDGRTPIYLTFKRL